jgi:hypothetical protein
VEKSRSADVTTLTKVILATGASGTAVNDLWVDRQAIVLYLNLLQKSIKMGHIGLNELPHRIAVSSTIKSVRGNSDDLVIVVIGVTTATKATGRMILDYLRSKGQHHKKGGNEMRIPFLYSASPGIPHWQVRVRE